MAPSGNAALTVALLALLLASPVQGSRSLRLSKHRNKGSHKTPAVAIWADGLGAAHGVGNMMGSRMRNETNETAEPEHHDAAAEEHSGSPGEGGEPMVPRTHEADGAEKKHEWSYQDPASWKAGYPSCGGDMQSPINLVKPPHSHDESQKLNYNYHPLSGLSLDNNGHNIQVNGAFGSLHLPDGEYQVAQFNFHFPSEHEIDGKISAGEMQIVHQKVGSTGSDDLAIVSVLLEAGSTLPGDSIPFLENLGFKGELPAEGVQKPIPGPVNIGKDFAHQLIGDFFHYKGSLTTPPCSETVHWFVVEEPASVTQEMVEHFKSLFPSSNNRPVQALNGRELVEDSFTVKGEYKSGAVSAAVLPLLALLGAFLHA